MIKRSHYLSAGITLVFLLACNTSISVGHPTEVTVTIAPSLVSTEAPRSTQLTLFAQPYSETSQEPSFTITAQIPQLSGSEDPRVQAFNQRMDEVVQSEIAAFRGEFLRTSYDPSFTGSSLEITYELAAQHQDIWSLKIFYSFYVSGAAHPGDFSHTVNYDLGAGRELSLGDLFMDGSNYLEVISNYCLAELRKQPFADSFSTSGAAPTLENYRNWNITPDGLRITFDTYQVAPGAAGPQIVTIPYDQLQAVIDPLGPLSRLPE